MTTDAVEFLWDPRPGMNVDHIADHGLTTDMWEAVFMAAQEWFQDKDDATIAVAEARIPSGLFRIVWAWDGDHHIVPITVIPITGFRITRRVQGGNES